MRQSRRRSFVARFCLGAAVGLPLAAWGDEPAKPVDPKAAVSAPKPAEAKPAAKPAEVPIPALTDPAFAAQFSRARSPQETIDSIQLPPGYHLQLVASEPDIISPVCMAWDGNGAMYICEMRTYMLDIDGGKTKERKSRVSRLESTKGDGVYDRLTVFADGLMLPRQLLPLDDRILVRETDTKDIFSFRDTKGDGVSDEKKAFFKGGSVGGNLEHQSSNLTWNIDNWMYQTVDDTRFHYSDGKLTTEKLPGKVGQWGYAVDDTGRMIFATAGAERPAHDFQVPLIYGAINLQGELAKDFTEVYGLVKLTDYQGGPVRVAPGGGLNRFTGCAGPSIYRGDALPKDLYGDYILPEPVGRIIRRAKVTNVEGKTVLTNAYDKKEFMASTDANFRPVFSATGPDGCLYILDMYHGIIQESNWTGNGSYLRKEIQRYGLDKHINAGRIYRLVHDDFKPHFEKPHMLSETAAQLVAHLSHPNGWWRDTAQKLIVLKGDKSVVPALKALVTADANPITRLHALWTLDGLQSADSAVLVEKLKDSDPWVRSAAIRICEPLIKKNDATIMAALKPLAKDADANVVKQYCLSMLYAQNPQAEELTKAVVDASAKESIIPTVVKHFKEAAAVAKAEKEKPAHLDKKYAVAYFKGKDLFAQTCIACHGLDGKGAPAPEGEGLTLAPPLKGSKRLLSAKGVPISIVLHGLVGPHENGKIYPNEMAALPWADDNMVSQILTYARNEWGNQAEGVEAKDVADIRKSSAARKLPFTFPEVLELQAKLTPTQSIPESAMKPEMKMRSPQETIASIQLPPGYHLQLVASEPQIISPVNLSWDGNGRMYVAEMRTYMLDIDGKGTMEKTSRVSRFESSKGDGVYDKHTVFADGLLLPRMVLPLDDRVLIRETNTKDIISYRDTEGEGVATEKAEFFKGGGRGANLEHQPSGLIWNIDNWLYISTDGQRLRYTRGKVETDNIYNQFAQWGLGMDDVGRMFYSSAGYEKPAFDFQEPIIYGNLEQPGELANDFTAVWPILQLPDVQGGPPRARKADGENGRSKDGGLFNTLNRFTGCAGQSIYRGDALPPELYGNLFLPEPVGRLIRRATVTNVGGKSVLTNAYDKKEFLVSADPNFRPVWTATGPDGCLYICDMYHGIIQESEWTREGSYLRGEIQKVGLDHNIKGGRIYRLVHDDYKPHFEKPHMLDETPAQLVAHLSNANGWWRDTAQKLLVLKGDKSVVPALQSLAREGQSPLGRLHALWTLEGLDAADAPLLIAEYKDADARVRAAAVRISEPLIKKNNPAVMAALKPLSADKDPNVVIQYSLSLLYTKNPDAPALTAAIVASNEKNDVVKSVIKKWNDEMAKKKAEEEKQKLAAAQNATKAAAMAKGKDLFGQTCIACHGLDGKGVPAPEGNGLTLAPPLKGSKRLLADKSVPIRLVIYGLTGPHEGGKVFPNEMAGFPWADDVMVASILTYARGDFGNNGSAVEPKDVAEVRKATAGRKLPFTFPEISEYMTSLTKPAKPAEKKAADNKPAVTTPRAEAK
jgi:mono/diheme cytochrome c family protein/glucose/arabinose dehydrogenase